MDARGDFTLLLWISASEKRSWDHISKSHKHCVKSFCLMASNPQRVWLKRFCRASSVLCNLWLVCVTEEVLMSILSRLMITLILFWIVWYTGLSWFWFCSQYKSGFFKEYFRNVFKVSFNLHFWEDFVTLWINPQINHGRSFCLTPEVSKYN